ncbi:MAG: heavy metal-binding domain-containing protein [Desulfomicrobium escambiense]|nr:heavy metal-binding domain-containing protein [Desulfomicrobium escambiense]
MLKPVAGAGELSGLPQSASIPSAAPREKPSADRAASFSPTSRPSPARPPSSTSGLVAGSTIRAKHIGRDIMASFRNLVGGEIKSYTELLQESRQQATERMVEQARQLGANAVVNVRYSTSSIAQGAAELYAYGTAVRVE